MEGCPMGQVLHGSARTTEAVRRAIQHSQASLRVLAQRHGINPKTVAKWKKRPSVQDERTGPKEPRSTVLSPEEVYRPQFVRHRIDATRREPRVKAGSAARPRVSGTRAVR